ncbi:hypothetical protein GQ600_2939 [Phytophthora cactorum]|nr:hypothetical protein GQ600_2939 [Phytophthora cactorum]
MSRRGYRSTSLFPPRGPAKSPVRQRVCNSAPTEVIPDQEEDWDWGLVQEEDDNTVMQRDQEEGDVMRIIEEMEIRAVSEEHPTKIQATSQTSWTQTLPTQTTVLSTTAAAMNPTSTGRSKSLTATAHSPTVAAFRSKTQMEMKIQPAY